MAANKLFLPYKSLFTPPIIHQNYVLHKRKHVSFRSRAVMTEPAENADSSSSTTSKTVYKDSWFDLLAINHLNHCLQKTSGLKTSKSGYDGLVETVMATAKNFSSFHQQILVIDTLDMAIPRPIFSMIKTLFPPSKFAREYFAAFTTIFFAWLVGPCEVREAEIDGEREKCAVFIKKCRLLEEANCVGICTNMCKYPTQAFLRDAIGVHVNMIPNFDDMSCEMIFGQEPPRPNNDPALKQPCYKLCKAKKQKDCSQASIGTRKMPELN